MRPRGRGLHPYPPFHVVLFLQARTGEVGHFIITRWITLRTGRARGMRVPAGLRPTPRMDRGGAPVPLALALTTVMHHGLTQQCPCTPSAHGHAHGLTHHHVPTQHAAGVSTSPNMFT